MIEFSIDAIAQMSHFGWGVALVLALHLFGTPLWCAYATVVGLAGLKEGAWDVHYETVAGRGSGWRDWTFWLLGATTGLFLLLVKGWL